MYIIAIEDNRDGHCEVVAKFDNYTEAVIYFEDKVVPYLFPNFKAFIEKDESYEYGYNQSGYNDYDENRCGWYDDEDPIYDYYGEVEERLYWDRIFATPKSMVNHYLSGCYLVPSGLVDSKNLWYLGILRNLTFGEETDALHQARRSC